MTTSTAAERAFSLLNNLNSDQQTCTLADSILLSLFLSCSTREAVVPKNVNGESDERDST